MMAHCHMHLCPVVISLRRKPQGNYSHKLHYIVAIIGLNIHVFNGLHCVVGNYNIAYYLWHVMLTKLHMWLAMLSIRMLYIRMNLQKLICFSGCVFLLCAGTG